MLVSIISTTETPSSFSHGLLLWLADDSRLKEVETEQKQGFENGTWQISH